jgi:branched-chain amino acid transport system ATP-binding protein
MDEMLKLQSVDCSYGHIKALSGIDMDVKEKEIVTLIGNNGAGKSTTLNAICGILPQGSKRSGKIFYRGGQIDNLSSDKIIRKGICQVPEGRRIFPLLTVEENLLMGGYLRKKDKQLKEDLEIVYALFPVLLKRKRQPGGQLSGGEQQMLALGRGLMAHPDLLLLDEPSLGLSPVLVQEIFRVIGKINDSGTTIFLVEQNAKLALKSADRGYVLEKGNIVLQDSSDELLSNNDVRKIYLGEN